MSTSEIQGSRPTTAVLGQQIGSSTKPTKEETDVRNIWEKAKPKAKKRDATLIPPAYREPIDLQQVAKMIVPTPPVVATSCGIIQFGSPPETVKVWMRAERDVPTIYVLPDPMFREGVNYADIEFIIYWYSYVKNWLDDGKETTVVGTPEQIERMKTILQETIYGPTRESLQNAGLPPNEVDRIERECHYFLKKDSNGIPYLLDAFVRFVPFQEGVAFLDEKQTVSIRKKEGDTFIVRDNGVEKLVEFKDSMEQRRVQVACPSRHFVPPDFGMTTLGTSSGFDKEGLTSSLILWMNQEGLLVDPLAYIGSYLNALGISQEYIHYILLTHVHGDHDAGLIPFILLSDRKVKLLTTRVIFDSFLRKAYAITGQDFADKVNFVELIPNQKIQLGKGSFKLEWRWNFHSIPTIGFRIETPYAAPFGSVAFSGDTYLDPDEIDRLVEKKFMTKERAEKLHVYEADINFHENGIPPIHTDLEHLVAVAAKRKRSIILYHTPQPKGEDKDGLKVAPAGKHYIYKEHVRDPLSEYNSAIQLAFFNRKKGTELPFIEKISDGMIEEHQPGDYVIRQGELGETIYVIIHGRAVAINQNRDFVHLLGHGDFFGERSSILGKPHTTDIQALSTISLARLSGNTLEKLLDRCNHVNEIARKFGLFEPTLSRVDILQGLSVKIKRRITEVLDSRELNQEEIVFRQGDPGNALFIIQEGTVLVEKEDENRSSVFQKKLVQGEVFGEIAVTEGEGTPRNATVKALSPKVKLLRLGIEDYKQLCKEFPVVPFLFTRLAQSRSKDSPKTDVLG